jgi:HAE1 family hydrophobic/amphiphilic exporter-1
MRKLAQFSVRYPTTVLMAVLAVIILGYISFQRLGMDLFPHLNTPRLYVEIEAGERPPEEMETQFVSRLESIAVRGRNVTNVFSSSRVGKALITVEYQWNADMDEAFLDLQKAVGDFGTSSGADSITVTQLDPNARPVVVAAFRHDQITDLDSLRQTAENVIRNDLIRLPGVAAVDLVGERRREILVKTDDGTLEAYGLSMDALASTIQNFNRNLTGGSIVEMGIRYTIRGIGQLTSLDDLRRLIVAYKTPQADTGAIVRTPVYLRDVAEVRYEESEPENIVRFNGQPCLGLEIFKEASYNTTEASRGIRAQLAELEQSMPGYHLEVVQDDAEFIKSAIGEVKDAAIFGGLLAVLVLFFFLRRVSVTAVISVTIPVSLLAVFCLMHFSGLTLNLMTLSGLALCIGNLIDNSIVVVENIFRHVEGGTVVSQACVRGTGEVAGAVTSSTLTTIVVFLPIIYLHGVAGELFKEQALTVTFGQVTSLIVALTFIPMLFSRVMRPKGKWEDAQSVRFHFYGRLLQRILKRKWVVVAGAAALVTVTAAVIPFVGSEFMPRPETAALTIDLTLPEGTSLERTGGVVRNVETMVRDYAGKDLRSIYSRVGPAGTSPSASELLADENNAEINVVLDPKAAARMEGMIRQLERDLSGTPDLTVQFGREQTTLQTTLGTGRAPLVVEIKGKDLKTLTGLADGLKERLRALPELADIVTSFQAGRPEINIEIDKEQASRNSLRSDTIGNQIKRLLAGNELGEMEEKGEYLKIMLKSPEFSLTQLDGLMLEGQGGRRIPLRDVARLTRSESPREIIRNNQVRVAEVRAQIAGKGASFDQIVAKVRAEMAKTNLPQDYTMSVTGEEALRRESFKNLKFALILAIILVYMVMAAQFESLLHPFVILLTIPLAAVGAIWIHIALGLHLNIMSYIGIIMLSGIAVSNSIILIDFINQSRRAGMGLDEAIVYAGRMRIRPILMMSAATILGILPMTIGIGEGASLRAPLALAVTGGLVTSTVLTLVVIPAVYRLIGRGSISAGEHAS